MISAAWGLATAKTTAQIVLQTSTVLAEMITAYTMQERLFSVVIPPGASYALTGPTTTMTTLSVRMWNEFRFGG
jgi:hypothetical protein